MAQENKTLSFKNATIELNGSLEQSTITEYHKDETNTYRLMDVLKNWAGIDGISLSLKQVEELPEITGEDE